MYDPSLLADLTVKNGAKIKRSQWEINDAIAASPQAKIVVSDSTRFDVEEGSDFIIVDLNVSVSAPVITHVGDAEPTDVEYGRNLWCEAVLDIATMRVQEGSLTFEGLSSSEDVTANKERLTKEAEQQAREQVFSRQHVANYVTGLPYGEHANPIYPPNSDETPDCGDSMDYVQAVRLGLVENPEPWLQALVDDLRSQCRALFDDDETYCDPASAEAGNGSFSDDLYPIRDRIHNIILAGMCGEGEWAAYAPLIRAATHETVRKLYRLPEELPLLKVDELPVSAEDTKTLGELLSTMELVGVSTPDQGKLVEHYQRLRKLHEGFTHYTDLWERLAEGDAGEDLATRIADYNEQVNSVEDCSNAIADALRAVEHTLKVNGVIRYLYQAQEKRGKVKPLQDLDCLALGAYVQDSPDADSLGRVHGGKPLSELNTFFTYEQDFAEAESERVYSDNADFLARYFPFPVIANIPGIRAWNSLNSISNERLAALTISALTHNRKPWSKDAHRALMTAFVAAGTYDMSYVESRGAEELSAVAPHHEVLAPLVDAAKTLYKDLHKTYMLPHSDENTVYEVAQTFIDDINTILPLLDSLYELNKQWLVVKNHLLRDGSTMDKEYEQERQERAQVVDLLMKKLGLADADVERVGLSRQLLLGESEALSEFLVEKELTQVSWVNYQFMRPEYWDGSLHSARNPSHKGLFRIAAPMSMIGARHGGVQGVVVTELIRAFNYSNRSRCDVVFTKEESEMILDYVRNGDVQSDIIPAWGTQASYGTTFSAISRKVQKSNFIAHVAYQPTLIRGLLMKLDSDCHIILSLMIAPDADDAKVTDERARLARELESNWVHNYRYYGCTRVDDALIAVGGTSKGDTSVWNGEVIPHFRGTIGDLLDVSHRSGYMKLSSHREAYLVGGDPRTQCTYWQLCRDFQQDFVSTYMRR